MASRTMGAMREQKTLHRGRYQPVTEKAQGYADPTRAELIARYRRIEAQNRKAGMTFAAEMFRKLAEEAEAGR